MSEKPEVDILSLANCSVYNENNKTVKLHRMWDYKTTVFVFVRHFACIACRAHVADVWKNRKAYEEKGAQIVFIGNGHAHFIQTFKEDLNLEGANVYTNPGLCAFKAAGFKRGFLAALGPKSLKEGLSMYKEGHRQASYSKEKGDLWQLGGVLVVAKEGRVIYHHINESLGDFPPDKDILEEKLYLKKGN